MFVGSVVSKTGGTEEDVKLKLGRARVAFRMMDKVCTSNVYSRRTKLRLYNSNVKQLLLYGSETWRSTKALTNKIQLFINRSLRRILGIKWYDKMSNVELWKATDQESAEVLLKRRWTWLGHTLRKPRDSIARRALQCNPQGQGNRGRPKNTWRRGVEQEMKEASITWVH